MSDLDKKILLSLLKNSARPVVEIAKEVGATRQTVAKKIEEMQKSGVIKAFTVKVSPESFGLHTKAYVFLHEEPDPLLRKGNEQKIKQMPEVSEFYRLFGRYSAVVEVLVKNSNELAGVVKKIHKLKGVRETETFIVHSAIKSQPEAPLINLLQKK